MIIFYIAIANYTLRYMDWIEIWHDLRLYFPGNCDLNPKKLIFYANAIKIIKLHTYSRHIIINNSCDIHTTARRSTPVRYGHYHSKLLVLSSPSSPPTITVMMTTDIIKISCLIAIIIHILPI